MTGKKNKKKKLTEEQLYQQQAMEELVQEFQKKGYKSITKTLTILKANLLAFVTAGPIAVLCYFIYVSRWREGSFGISDLTLFIIGILVLIVVHELVHGITWAAWCKNRWKSIRFGILVELLTPYCHCMEPLTIKQYIIGALMPLLVVGLVPFTISFIIGNHLLMALSLLMILGAGGDVTMVLLLLKERKDALVLDHPTLCGCVVFKKQE